MTTTPADYGYQDLPLKPNGHRELIHDKENLVTVLRIDGRERVIGVQYSCAVCDERPHLQVTPDAVEVVNPCPFPDGITTEITLAVPSGKIVVTDDLRPLYDWDDNQVGDYNTAAGQANAIRAMAAAGCAYGPVGNSCPDLYRTGPDSYTIARSGWNDEDEDLLPAGERLAGICTDLWAYSIADLDDFLQRGGDVDSFNAEVVEVTPGTYRFVHLTGRADFDHDATGPLVFARIQRIA